MSNKSSKKAKRSAERAARESKQANKLIFYIVAALIILFIACLIGFSR